MSDEDARVGVDLTPEQALALAALLSVTLARPRRWRSARQSCGWRCQALGRRSCARWTPCARPAPSRCPAWRAATPAPCVTARLRGADLHLGDTGAMTRYRPEYQDRHAPVSAMEPEDRRDLPARREYDDLATPARRARPIFRAGHWQHDPACPLRLRAEQDRPLNPEHEMDNVPPVRRYARYMPQIKRHHRPRGIKDALSEAWGRPRTPLNNPDRADGLVAGWPGSGARNLPLARRAAGRAAAARQQKPRRGPQGLPPGRAGVCWLVRSAPTPRRSGSGRAAAGCAG